MNTKEFPWAKVGPAHRGDNSALLVVPNGKLRVEAKHSIHHILSLHDLLREDLPSPFTIN
jgi:hypothetical protein